MYRSPKRLASGEKVTCSPECKFALMHKAPNTECAHCGKPIYKSPSQLRERNFCSPECHYESRIDRTPNAICAYCGKAFWRYQYDLDRAAVNYCSHRCRAAAKRTRVEGRCAVCGEPVVRTQAQRRKSRHGEMFCSRVCAMAWQLEMQGPNGLEQDFLAAFPDLRFVGDGKFWLRDDEGWMNPDFILPETDRLIELYGNFWHSEEEAIVRTTRLNRLGYRVLIVWESDFREHPDVTFDLVSDYLSEP